MARLYKIPGPRSRRLGAELSGVESPNVTFMGPPGPIFWRRARGHEVWDVDGNRYVDFTSAFGVASLGHNPNAVRRAIRGQSRELIHGMGDVHPTEAKVQLLSKLSELTFERWTKGAVRAQSVLCNSGFESVEVALKTALLATGRSRIVAFAGAYHGLGYGSLQVTWHQMFRAPFSSQLRRLTHFLPYPRKADELESVAAQLRMELRGGEIGAVVVEPAQARAGHVFPPNGFLKRLRAECDRLGTLLVCDEIFTGFWRTGVPFAVEREQVVPDLICLGKALSGTLPISACVGTPQVMSAWPRSEGEAIHTSTFLGNPLACAAALASIAEWRDPAWRSHLACSERALREALDRELARCPRVREIRGRGLMFGVELTDRSAPSVCQRLLERGFILLPAGEGDVLALSPPFKTPHADFRKFARALREVLCERA
ncbi:MAG: aspartate aminotransferase family protein [Verrucomicrobiae bacterium]|nr:aspartate aminotransferase family protein [Verrucomicrobiae bacterium]